ncbi:MAG: hypothetical protein FWE41_04730 [Coriobacteriia bacterium]|nr:hypothetical protein [Coriobacteriia bacterium]
MNKRKRTDLWQRPQAVVFLVLSILMALMSLFLTFSIGGSTQDIARAIAIGIIASSLFAIPFVLNLFARRALRAQKNKKAARLQIATTIILILLAALLVAMAIGSNRLMVVGAPLLIFFTLYIFVIAPITWLVAKSFNVKKQKNSKRLRLAAAIYLAALLTIAVIAVGAFNGARGNSSDSLVIAAAVEYLEVRYPDEEFERGTFSSSGGPDNPEGTYQVYFSPAAGKDLVFEVQMPGNNLEDIKDNYIYKQIEKKLKKTVEEGFEAQGLEADTYFFIELDNEGFNVEPVNDMREFMLLYPEARIRGEVFIQRNDLWGLDLGVTIETVSRNVYEAFDCELELELMICVVNMPSKVYENRMQQKGRHSAIDWKKVYFDSSEIKSIFIYNYNETGGDIGAEEQNERIAHEYQDELLLQDFLRNNPTN